MQSKNSDNKVNRIAWPVSNGHIFTTPEEILYCKAEGSYTKVQLQNGRDLFISYNLRKIETALDGLFFFRTHNSYLINLQHASTLMRTDNEFMIEINGILIPVAKARRKNLLGRFREL